MDCSTSRSLCPSPFPKVCPSSCPLHWWYHPAISSSDVLFSFYSWSVPASGTFPMSHLFASDDQNTRAASSASVLPMTIQGWFPLRSTGLICAVQWTLRSLIQLHSSKASILRCSAFFMVQLSQPYVTYRTLNIWKFLLILQALLKVLWIYWHFRTALVRQTSAGVMLILLLYECMFSPVWLFTTPWTGACQTPLSIGFSRQEYSSGLAFPSPGDLPDPGIESVSLASPALAGGFLYHWATWEAILLLRK